MPGVKGTIILCEIWKILRADACGLVQYVLTAFCHHQHIWQVIVFILLKVFPEPHTRIGKVPAFFVCIISPSLMKTIGELCLIILKKSLEHWTIY